MGNLPPKGGKASITEPTDEPLLLNVEMCDFIHDGESVNRPNNAMEIYLTELDNESPRLVRLIMKSVYENDKRRIRHIGCKRFGIQYLLSAQRAVHP